MKALPIRISPVHLAAMLLAIPTSFALHAGPGPGDPGRPQPANLQETSSSSESGSDLQGHAHGDPHSRASLAEPITAPEGGWASDAPLRQGMQAILDAALDTAAAETRRQLGPLGGTGDPPVAVTRTLDGQRALRVPDARSIATVTIDGAAVTGWQLAGRRPGGTTPAPYLILPVSRAG